MMIMMTRTKKIETKIDSDGYDDEKDENDADDDGDDDINKEEDNEKMTMQ